MTRERRGIVTAMNGRSAMGFYAEWIVPGLMDLSMRNSGCVHIESAWRAQPKAACSTSESVLDSIFLSMRGMRGKSSDSIRRPGC